LERIHLRATVRRSDRWKGGIHHYIDWMLGRVIEMHRVLKPTGSFYLHCDASASHYLKVMVDGVFAARNFRNEIIWRSTPFSGSSKARARQYPRTHDTLLFYSKTNQRTWNTPTEPYTEEYLRRFKWDDDDGRGPYRKTLLKTFSEETFERLRTENRLVAPIKTGAKWSYKQYLSESSGTRQVGDIWSDINALNPVAKERLGYPTQKPEALLERVIEGSSNPGDVVLDPFCGCGTTLAVAERLGRRWLGMDISPTAINLVRARLRKLGAEGMRVEGLPETAAQLRDLKPFEFQNWVIQRLHGTHSPRKTGDMGIDGYSFMQRLPVQIKRSDRVGRNVVDNFQTAVRRNGSHGGYIVAFSFGRGAYEEAARAKSDGLEITLVTVKTLLEAATAVPLPGVDQMLADIYEGVRMSLLDATSAGPPQVTAVMLVESDLAA
jgi:DNA modification methylase